jgi:predicted PurR-regulated permease PerM
MTILSLLAFFALSAWFIAPNIQEQAARLSETMSSQLGTLQVQSQSQWFDMLRAALEKLLATLSPVRQISDWLVDAVVIFFTSVYFAFEPKLYRRGVLSLAARGTTPEIPGMPIGEAPATTCHSIAVWNFPTALISL